jgi:hypothetical protein
LIAGNEKSAHIVFKYDYLDDSAQNPKRSLKQEFVSHRANPCQSLAGDSWLDADNNVNTPDVPKQNTYTWTFDANGILLTEVLDSFDDAADRTDSFVMDLFRNRRKRTTDKPSTAYRDEVITYLYVIDWRRTSMRRKSHNVIGFYSPTSSVSIP